MTFNQSNAAAAKSVILNVLNQKLVSRSPGGRSRAIPGITQRLVGNKSDVMSTSTTQGSEAVVNPACSESNQLAGKVNGDNNSYSEDDAVATEAKEKENQVRKELGEALQLLNNARGSLELLREIYEERNQKKLEGADSFSSLKELYGKKIVEYGGLAQRHRKMRNEVKAFHKSNDCLQKELDQMRGRVQENPWSVGVPYGYNGTGGKRERRRY